MKLFRRDGRTLFERERGDRLADVAVVVDDLGQRETEPEQLGSMPRRGRADDVR
jgi:polysaccharide deacetylase 2 family uncharacterized protein YibQ